MPKIWEHAKNVTEAEEMRRITKNILLQPQKLTFL